MDTTFNTVYLHGNIDNLYRMMKIKINDYLKIFLIDSTLYGLIILAIESFVSNEINVWMLILLSISMGALSSYSFVNAIKKKPIGPGNIYL